MLTQNAIGNLVNRYNAVLKKCTLLNTFGTLALASCIAISSQTMSYAASLSEVTGNITSSETYESGTLNGYQVTIIGLTGGDSIITGNSTILALTGSTSLDKLSKGSLYVEDGATLLLGGNTIAPTIDGSIFIDNATVKLVCDKTTNTLYVNGSDGIVLNGNATLNFDIGTTTSSSLSAISLENGNNTITVGTSTTDASGKTSMTSATIEISSGLSLENDTLSIIVGTMTIKSLSITDDSTVYVGTGTLTVTGASTFNTSDFVSDSTEKGIYIDGTMKFSDSLTIVTTEDDNTIAIDGTLSADSLIISGDEALLLTSGTLTVSDGSAFKKMITGDVVVSGTDAALKLSSSSSGNTTGTVDSITISDGASLSISSIAVTLNKGETIDISDSTLTISSGASLDTTSGTLVLSNATVTLEGTLTANFSDFASIDENGDITFVEDLNKFDDGDGTLVLNSNAYITVADLKAYVEVIKELNIYLYSGTITTDFLTVADMSENSLDDILANMTIDLATKSTDAGSGVLSEGQDVTLSHLTNEEKNETLTVSNGSLLTLTGQGSDDGLVFNGNLEVTGDGSVLSIGKVVAPNIVATKTSTYIGGDITISDEGEFIVQNTMLSSEDEDNPINVSISGNGVLTVSSNSTLDVENIVVSDSKGVSIQVGVSNTDTSEYNTIGLSSLIVTGSITLDGTALVLQNGWYSDLRIGSAAYTVINTFDTEDGMIDGYLLVGQNSYLVLGDTVQSWAQEAFNYSGYLWNDGDNSGSEIEAALFINTPQVLDTDVNASILVDGDLYKNTANMESTSSTSGLSGLTLSGSFIGFGENTLLVVNAENLNGEAALSFSDLSSDTDKNYFSVADTSQLLIVNAEVDTTITIISGVYINSDGEVETAVLGGDGTLITDTGISGWNEENVKSASGLIGIDSVDFIIETDSDTGISTGSYTVSFVQLDANILYPTASSEIRAMMNNVTASYGDDTESPYAGIAFISRSVNSNYFSATTDSTTVATVADATDGTTNSNVAASNEVAVANLLEGAVRLSSVVGVANATSKASTLGTNSILERTSLKTPVASRLVSMPLNSSVNTFYAQNDSLHADDMQSEKKSHFVSERGAGIWAMPLYMTSSTDGLSAGSFETGYDTTVYGAAIGADVTFKDIYFLGLGFNVGSGSSDSTGDFSQSTNDFSFWGMSLYGGVQFDNFGLTIDVGYTTSSNDVQQDMPATMQMSSLTADVNSSVWTTGLRLEYLLETSYVDFLPYVGLRYSSVRVGDHDIKSKNLNGSYDFSDDTIFIVDGTAQEVYTLPLGLSMSTDLALADWTISPRVDLGLILAGGDLDATTSWGVSALVGENSKVKTEVFDELTYTGGLGLTAKKDNLSFGLNYKINNSEHETSHMVFGSVRYEFGMDEAPRKTDRASLGEEYGEFLAAQSAASQAPENTSATGELAPVTSSAPSSAFIAVSGTSTAAKANEDSYELPSVNSSDSYELAPVQASHDAESYSTGSTRAANTQENYANTELAAAYSDGVQAQTNEYGEEYIIIDDDDADVDFATTEDDVHVLATVEVEKQDVQAGVHSIGGQALQMIPNSTNMITGALRGMSNIQFSNSDMSNQQGGEISPPRISIYGSKPYENNFMIDGMTITNTFNPSGLTDRGNQNDLTVGGGDQDIFYDTNLVERIDVYTNNVPARFGNFNGGVVDATLRDPRKDKWHFRVSGNTTDSKWYSIGDVDEDSQTADAQPVYSIYKFSGTAEGPINDTVSMLMGYTNVYSIIPLTMRNSLGEYSVKDQRRMSENFFVKTLIEPSDDLRFTVDMTYAPYEEYRWRENWVNSEYTTDNETIRLAGTMKYSASLGDVEAKLSLMNSGYSYHATSNSIYQETGVDDDTLYSGGYGDRETNKMDINSTLSFTSHDFKKGWLNWNFETGVNIAYSSLGIEAENALVDVKAYDGSYDSSYRYTEAIYNEVDSYDALTTLGYYFQTELKVDRVKFTPGFRIDTDDFTGNVDIAPRLKLEVDTLDNKMLNVMVGYNRYYGTALREYAFDRTRSGYYYNWEYDENGNVYSTEGGNKANSITEIDLDGLETPYSDEFTAGIFGRVLGFDYKLDYTYRDHKNQLISVEDEIRTIVYEGSSFSQTVEKLTNNGRSTYRGLTLTLEKGVDFGDFGKHTFGLGATIAKTKTFNGSYDDTVDLDYSGYTAVQNTSKVFYNGELIDKSDMPAEDYNSPLTLTFTWQTSFFDDRLRLYSLNRWKDDSRGIMADSRSDKYTPYGTMADDGESNYWYTDSTKTEFATAYKEGTIRGGLISDLNLEFDVLKHEDYTLGLTFDIYNIFNTNIGVSATEDGSGGTDSVRRSFWLGMYATF